MSLRHRYIDVRPIMSSAYVHVTAMPGPNLIWIGIDRFSCLPSLRGFMPAFSRAQGSSCIAGARVRKPPQWTRTDCIIEMRRLNDRHLRLAVRVPRSYLSCYTASLYLDRQHACAAMNDRRSGFAASRRGMVAVRCWAGVELRR